MEAGRELDARVTEELWKDTNPYPSFKPSTNAAHAWEVVEKLIQDNLNWDVEVKWSSVEKEWYVTILDRSGLGTHVKQEVCFVWAETAPLAICLAALKVVGEEG